MMHKTTSRIARHVLRFVPFIVSLVAVACVPEPPSDLVASTESAQLVAEATTEGEGGLVPAPSGCSAERSCGKPTLLCKRPDAPRPCGAAGCVEMQLACSADADCREGYHCKPCAAGDPWPCGLLFGKCQPRPCARDRDCGSANLICTAGACEHKPCRRSASCRGYCVSGACWNEPGWCFDTTLPPPP